MTIKKMHPDNMMLVLVLALIIIFVINIFAVYNLSLKIQDRKKELEELARPARVELTTLTLLTGCQDCFNVFAFVDDTKKQPVNVYSEKLIDANSPEGKLLVAQYNIGKLPTVIAKGELDKSNVANFFGKWQQAGDTSVYTAQPPPYHDVNRSRVVGRVELTTVTVSDCAQCSDIVPIIATFRQAGVKFVNEKTVVYNSTEGRMLINRYNIRNIPAAVISDEIDFYPGMAQLFTQLNATKREGSYAIHVARPPYIDADSGKTVGLVDIIYLNDSTCATCYDVSIQKRILTSPPYLVAVDEEKSYDVSSKEGKELIIKYKIEKVPTIVLSPDADAYASLKQVWTAQRGGVGTIESDGSYVFRATEFMGSWKNLTSGGVV